MNWINIVTHPILVLILFCGILISGEHFGGFYLIYILMALPYGGNHAILALSGVALVLFSYVKYKRQSKFFFDPLLNILGVFSLFLSLLVFFYNTWNYNDGTFRQTTPIISLTLFCIISLGFLVRSVIAYAKSKPERQGLPT